MTWTPDSGNFCRSPICLFAYLYKMTRDIPGCQIEGFLQIAHLKSDLIWQQESPAEKWKRLLHPNQTFLYNAMGELSSCKIRIPAMLNNNLKSNLVRIGVVDRIFAIITLSLSGAQNSHGFSFLRTNLDWRRENFFFYMITYYYRIIAKAKTGNAQINPSNSSTTFHQKGHLSKK